MLVNKQSQYMYLYSKFVKLHVMQSPNSILIISAKVKLHKTRTLAQVADSMVLDVDSSVIS